MTDLGRSGGSQPGPPGGHPPGPGQSLPHSPQTLLPHSTPIPPTCSPRAVPAPAPGGECRRSRLSWAGAGLCSWLCLCLQPGPAKWLMCLFYWKPEPIPRKSPGAAGGRGGGLLGERPGHHCPLAGKAASPPRSRPQGSFCCCTSCRCSVRARPCCDSPASRSLRRAGSRARTPGQREPHIHPKTHLFNNLACAGPDLVPRVVAASAG